MSDPDSSRPSPESIAFFAERIGDVMYREIMSQRERILTAFIAEHGCPPSEIIQCVTRDGKWFARRMTKEEIEFRDLVQTKAQPPARKILHCSNNSCGYQTANDQIKCICCDAPLLNEDGTPVRVLREGYTSEEFTPEVKRGKMFGREVKLATCENCNNHTVTSDGICFTCGHGAKI